MRLAIFFLVNFNCECLEVWVKHLFSMFAVK
jgi:hypothetical protein